MSGIISTYSEPIIAATILFPFVAGLFTLPFIIYHYRRFGSIAFIRNVIVYSFILYLMCTYFLTILPLPSFESVRQMRHIGINWIPFSNFYDGLCNMGFSASDSSTWFSAGIWIKFLKSRELFQILANIVMQVPLGFYLRYYFQRSFKQTILIGFLISLFFELTQLSGLYFLYPQPYRCPDINDLLTNTLGAALGFISAPLITWMLPDRKDIDRISWEHGREVTLMRRILAAAIDWIILSGITALLAFADAKLSKVGIKFSLSGLLAMFPVLIYFCLLQYICGGRTPGKFILKLKTVCYNDKTKKPKLIQLVIRYMILYIVAPFVLCFDMFILSATAISFMSNCSSIVRILGIVGCAASLPLTLGVVLHTEKKTRQMPHSYFSHTLIVQTGRKSAPSEAKQKKHVAAKQV